MKSKIAIFLSIFAISSQVIFGQSQALAHKKSNRDIIIHIVGDVHGEKAIKREALPTLKKYFRSGDLNIFNLETAVTDADVKEEKEYNFKTDLAFLKALKEIGFNVATVANNHSYDYGLPGFMDTLQNLKAAGISYVGGGKNSESAYHGRVYKVRGMRIGVLGFAKVNGGPDSIAKKDKPGITDGYDARSTESAITHLRELSDVLIILSHWGEEGSFCTRDWEIASAKKWLSLGADIIVGSHTHTVQPIALEKNKLVAYSLGNFIFYSSKIENRTTGILKIRISSEKKISYKWMPFMINNLTKVPERSFETTPAVVDCENQAKTTVR
jgi:poly-gamma-glutamate synthesis protein (capsule biosynthesis protein)